MQNQRFLVIGATGHVGSKVAILLANRGYDVTAMTRRREGRILDPHEGAIRYVVGDLNDESSIARALRGIDVVVNTANGVVPQSGGGNAGQVNERVLRLIDLAEEAGVRRFVQSSVPPYRHEQRIPELRGKRRIEERLFRSTMQTVVVRNPAFMDVWLVMGGFQQAADPSAHATTARRYGFVAFWMKLVGNLSMRHGLFLAPGGAKHGTPMIATRDVAELLFAGATLPGSEDRLIEAGGPEWLTWREIADIIALKVGRKRVRVLGIPSWLARVNQLLATPFSSAIANNFALISFVADEQPHWEAARVVEELGVPRQLTVSDYIDHAIAKSRSGRT